MYKFKALYEIFLNWLLMELEYLELEEGNYYGLQVLVVSIQ